MQAMAKSNYVLIGDLDPATQAALQEAAKPLFPPIVNQAAAATLVYHGYKRTGSAGWAVAWGFLGYMAPLIGVPVALAQGFAKKKGK
jgi:hypothetical protein